MMKRSLLVIFFLSVGLTYTFSQTKVSLKLDSNRILIGEQVLGRLDLQYLKKGNDKVEFAQIADTLAQKVEVLKRSNLFSSTQTLENNDVQVSFSQTFVLTAFDAGTYQIGPFEFNVNGEKISTDAQPLTVRIPTLADSAQFSDIKDIIDVKPNLWDWIVEYKYYVIAGLLLLILVGFIAYKIYKNRKNINISLPAKPEPKVKIIPHEVALKALAELESKKLWQSGKVKEYHSDLTLIIREYLESQFSIRALEETTDQIISNISYIGLQTTDKQNLKRILVIGDLAKFAKKQPTPSENEESINLARIFITNTIPVEETTKTKDE